MINDEIYSRLISMQDVSYRDFQSPLIPTVNKDSMIGVRTPALRTLARELSVGEDTDLFLHTLPHRYFEENQLHAFIIDRIKNYDECLAAVNEFLPYVDNWATCDQLSPAVFGKNKPELLSAVRKWLADSRVYTVRFGIKMLMTHFADEDFLPEYPELVCSVKSGEYYIDMMVAWYFATLLAKQYESIMPYLESRRLPVWTHNKAIQKACESRRITPAQKDHLRTLKLSSK